MHLKKHPLRRDRLRSPPREGWSWIDRRFLREKAPQLQRDAILLYFFLAAVSDKHGLSYWSDASVAAHLRMSEPSVAGAREELLRHDLVAYQSPLYQVLSFPSSPPSRRESEPCEPTLLAEILRQVSRSLPTDNNPCPPRGLTP